MICFFTELIFFDEILIERILAIIILKGEDIMPKSKKEGIIFGLCMCFIMVFFMGALNISIHMGGVNARSLIIALKAFPVTFIIALLVESLIVQPIDANLLRKFSKDSDSDNAKILFNCFFIVTMMSFTMTIIGGLLGGDSIATIMKEFFIRWPRNYFAAFFLNILVAGPISRMILVRIQENRNVEIEY